MSSIRALAADLTGRSDDSLRALFAARPDLISPPVPDFAALAARASTRVSVQRALENLTLPQTRVLESVHLVSDEDTGITTSAAGLKPVMDGSTLKVLESILRELHDLALLYRAEPDGKSRKRFYLPVSSLKDVVGPYPLGLGRSYQGLAASQPSFGQHIVELTDELRQYGYPVEPAATSHEAADALQDWVCNPAHWASLMAEAPEQTADLLAKFRRAAVGAVPQASRRVSVLTQPDDAGPLQWLLARGLLVPLDAEHVELPRQVGQAARGHVLVDNLQLQPQPAELSTVSAARRDNAAFSSAAEVLRILAELLGQLEDQPLATLRSGGIGVREIRRLSERLRIEERDATMTLELASMAALIELDPDTSQWMAGTHASEWLGLPRAEQWTQLLTGWLVAGRAPSLVGEPLPTGAVINPLAAEAARAEAPIVRRRTLEVLSELTAEAESGGSPPVLNEAAVLTRLIWHQPRLQRRFRHLVPGILREAELLGLTGSGALTDVGLATARGDLRAAAEQLDASLPKPLDYVLLQADLTAVAPGYLEPALARELTLLSDPEGQGPATTYRFSATSIRRALDAGRDGTVILSFLEKHSATEVPQPLVYLVTDTASRHGTLRVGAAGSYLRSEDEDTLAVLLSSNHAAMLGLRQIAPTVVVSRASAREVAVVLEELGLAPLIEHDDGGALGGRGARGGAGTGTATGTASAKTGPGRRQYGAVDATPPRTVPGRQTGAEHHRFGGSGPFSAGGAAGNAEADAQITRLRTADPGRSASTGESGPLISMETLNKAIRLKSEVSMGIVDGQGNHQRERLVPLSAGGGRVRVYDPAHEMERVISIHRVMDVELATEPETR